MRIYQLVVIIAISLGLTGMSSGQGQGQESKPDVSTGQIKWEEMTPIPDALGVAGPFAGVSNDFLVVAGGANFPQPVWETSKQWVDNIYALDLTADPSSASWVEVGQLPRPTGYGAAVSTPLGIICFGGNDATTIFDHAFVLTIDRNDSNQPVLTVSDFPKLPSPNAYSQAVLHGNKIFIATGQTGLGLDSTHNQFWSLDFSSVLDADEPDFTSLNWEVLPVFPGEPRAFAITTIQHDGFDQNIFLVSGRRAEGEETLFLKEHWKYNLRSGEWSRVADIPECVMAGTGFPMGQSHYLVTGGDTGELFFKADDLKDDHPGFLKKSWAYNAITDTWSEHGAMPANHVTTIPVEYKGSVFIPSGEVRPRVRSPKVWKLTPVSRTSDFGWVNSAVIVVYLLVVVGVGFYFSKRNANTDDYFTGGKRVMWWVAGCSVFATMLSSLTYTGIPSKAYAQDWVYAVANMMIPLVAFFAVFFALPFFRQLKSASAYEYLEIRFDARVRKVASGVFMFFHLFRMAVVMSLTSLALTVATPLTPTQSVIIMGVLCIAYSVSGGLEAVVWTDTVQTVVLMIGALAAFWYLLSGIDGGWTTFMSAASADQKFNMANFHMDPSSTYVAFWVIAFGALGQNVSSYTSDQAVVQRYLSTPTQEDAARAIWFNAGLSIVATILFFGIGTGLYVFFQSNPQVLDLTINNDQIFPYFIISQMPVGVAGIIIAGLFAAAQSTVSTSMNSMATAFMTDFVGTDRKVSDQSRALKKARIATLIFGSMGTILAFTFISPEIRSLFDSFIKVVGLFMGTLGGLFLLGMLTRRTHGTAALVGVAISILCLICVWNYTDVPSFLYPLLGVSICFAGGIILSKIIPAPTRS